MNSIPTKSHLEKLPGKKWQLDFGRDDFKKRKRLYFETEAEADAEITRLKKLEKSGGDYWMLISAIERQEIVGTLKAIKLAGLTLPDVWAKPLLSGLETV